ncbi:hypothetical protein ASPWEDRAFT_182669 [Aspergillus wentii DTO 134E9]|uniref:MARVEL domain-containing protein n=1 Tax=Aspergillus wentii DTO 134E9 TaxID=1073089 RepID=A0A1L9RSI1_ASPWE|nr:uncharacterized protein ASPWEDRAFT_182669 [Aspergillus wentii DTO 134E9]KAI9930693.1 hypothetical protein MW887_011448 [Aspergillus wentii]OJJ37854.1 hypothetical protein ASPWEDRAFT_182669 [Aspergillus wentii DTO 134E9]
MSFFFPTDFGPEYKATNIWMRHGAVLCSSLGLILLATRHIHPYTILFLVPVIWSFIDYTLHLREIKINPIVNLACDLLSTISLVWNIPFAVFAGLWNLSCVTIIMAILFAGAASFHACLFWRARMQVWGESEAIHLPL